LEDEETVFRICSDREIAAMTRNIPHPYPRQRAAEWIAQHPGLWQSGKACIFAVEEKSSSQLVAAVGLEIDEENQRAELGFWVEKTNWRRGICTEAAAATLRFGFESLALHKIQACCLTINPASGRVLQKIGLRHEGLLRGHLRKWGEFYDIEVYGLLRSEFLNRGRV
jgi:RimJ/RimL family protein N-acetyltransferase